MKPEHLEPQASRCRIDAGMVPGGLTAVQFDAETREILANLSMDAFNHAANGGLPFQQCIATVFLSGMRLAQQIGKEEAAPIKPSPALS
jgi:hypothetical protein